MFYFLLPQINGITLVDRKHNEAVELFRTAGEHVELRVLKKVKHIDALKSSYSRWRVYAEDYILI